MSRENKEEIMCELTLYVMGKTPDLESSIDDFKALLHDMFGDHYSLTVIDLLEDPSLAEEDSIFATPTLIKKHPGPVRRIIGDLSDGQRIIAGLGIGVNV